MAGTVRTKTLEEYENENYFLLWRSDKWHFPYNCLGPSDEKKTYQKEKKSLILHGWESREQKNRGI